MEMNKNYICKIYSNNKEFLGTGFFINDKQMCTAGHCVKDIEKGYVELIKKKYCFTNVKKIEELDFAIVIFDEEVFDRRSIEFNIDLGRTKKESYTYGYTNLYSEESEGMKLKLEEYPTEYGDKIIDETLMIRGCNDDRSWKGISGAPVWSSDGIRGIVLKEIYGDGIQTRLEAISFDKIINYLIEKKEEELLTGFPRATIGKRLNERVRENKNRCQELYRDIEHREAIEKIEPNCFNFENNINEKHILNEITEVLEKYALLLDDESVERTGRYFRDINEKIAIVEEYIGKDFNSMYIVLWMLAEGKKFAPKIGKILCERNGEFYERDIFISRHNGEGKIKFLIPFISYSENLKEGIENLITSMSREDSTLINLNDIQLDGEAVACLGYIEQYELRKAVEKRYSGVEIEIIALIMYNSKMYKKAKNITNKKGVIQRQYMDDIQNESYKYMVSTISEKKLNLFILPVNEFNKFGLERDNVKR
ncbi:MAG: hypothetical protein ACRC28_15160 [Clostridium sp.]|uniref:hypothetical protein n=1 Tax=Clostridium sp. TaxID=1506 RepID=UPI003F3D11A5